MTTTSDHGGVSPTMLRCPLGSDSIYPSLVLALRDMRAAHGRNEETGSGLGTQSWIGLSIGMTILDTLTGPSVHAVGEKWRRLLTTHGVNATDADDIYALRCSLLHGYYLPKLKGGRRMQLVNEQDSYAIDSDTAGLTSVSVPVFCRCLVERIAVEARYEWDDTLIDTDALDLRA
jgi:hypothetical protein